MNARHMYTLKWLFFLSIGVGVLGLSIFFQIIPVWAQKSSNNGIITEKQIVFEIRPGEGFHSITERLQMQGFITSLFYFKFLARLNDYDKKIKAGEYLLHRNMTSHEILETLVNGDVLLRRITIPEGLTMEQIACLIEQAGFGDAKKFIRVAENPETIKKLGLDTTGLEGYLFPETYFFAQNTSVRKIIFTMVGRFKTIFSDEWRKRAQEVGLTVHQIVILASIIEKETGVPEERPLIASVFHNRLKRNMRLESDPTVIYGIPNFDGNLTREHLNTLTPYNTYRIQGLPSGPIANPGYYSLKAALFPAESNYLYFVAKQDKTHYFSTNYADHNKAVYKYQIQKQKD